MQNKKLILTTFAADGSLCSHCKASFSKLDNQSELYSNYKHNEVK